MIEKLAKEKSLRERYDTVNHSLDKIKVKHAEFFSKSDILRENIKGYYHIRHMSDDAKIPTNMIQFDSIHKDTAVDRKMYLESRF